MIRRTIIISRAARRQANGSEARERESGGKRKAAEWTTLGVSTAILLGLAGFLIYEGVRPDPPFIPVQATPLLKQVRRVDDRFVLPVEIYNPGRKTVSNLQVELRSATGVEATITIDYLGQQTRRTVFALLDSDPRRQAITVEPRIYSAE